MNQQIKTMFLDNPEIPEQICQFCQNIPEYVRAREEYHALAQELEEACRKCIRVEVSNTAALSQVLDEEGISYAILSDTAADIYARVNVSHLALALSQRGCEIRTMEERDESLESFYVNLVGGDRT